MNEPDKLENAEAIGERLDKTHIQLMWRGKRYKASEQKIFLSDFWLKLSRF